MFELGRASVANLRAAALGGGPGGPSGGTPRVPALKGVDESPSPRKSISSSRSAGVAGTGRPNAVGGRGVKKVESESQLGARRGSAPVVRSGVTGGASTAASRAGARTPREDGRAPSVDLSPESDYDWALIS